jgi:hypothetical protein
MANDNTIKSLVLGTLQEQLIPLTNAFAGTTATAFAQGNGLVSGSGGTVAVLSLGNPGLYNGTGRPIVVRAFGVATGGASATTLTLTLYEVPGAALPLTSGTTNQQTFTTWNSLRASTARTITALTVNWNIAAEFRLSATGRLEGKVEFEIAGLLDVYAASSIISGLLGEIDLNFAVVSTMSASQAANVNNMTEFSLEQQ